MSFTFYDFTVESDHVLLKLEKSRWFREPKKIALKYFPAKEWDDCGETYCAETGQRMAHYDIHAIRCMLSITGKCLWKGLTIEGLPELFKASRQNN